MIVTGHKAAVRTPWKLKDVDFDSEAYRHGVRDHKLMFLNPPRPETDLRGYASYSQGWFDPRPEPADDK